MKPKKSAARPEAPAKDLVRITPTTVPDGDSAAALYRLMAWLSPSYPVGAFSYSSGIEWAVEAGRHHGCGHAHRLADGDDRGRRRLLRWRVLPPRASGGRRRSTMRLREVAELSAAFTPSKERHLETTAQGRAFIEATRAAWPCEAMDRLRPLGRTGHLSGRGRGRRRRTWHRGRAGLAGLSACAGRRTGFRPACGSFRLGRPTASACWPRLNRSSRGRSSARSNAARRRRRRRRSAPISPAMRHETQYTQTVPVVRREVRR